MSNLFDTKNFPDGVPGALVVGMSWGWRLPEISNAYNVIEIDVACNFYLQSNASSRFTVDAIVENGEFIFRSAPDETTKYSQGDYRYQLVLTRKIDGAKVVYLEGDTTLKSDFSVDGGDIRSHARKTLDAIKATIENTATKEQQSYTIAGRSLSRRPISELLELKTHYSRLVNSENSRAKKKTVRVILSGK